MSVQKIKYFLTHTLKIPNKESDKLIRGENILVNGETISDNILISEWDEVILRQAQHDNWKIIRPKKEKLYFLFNKPRGIESTLSKEIENSLVKFIPEGTELFYVGRLDKESEGLMLLTNHGNSTKKIPGEDVEKEYLVEVEPHILNEAIDENFKAQMENGVVILGKMTKPCKVTLLSENKFNIILTEGRNRQIRRMCHKLGMTVIFLKRLRIGNLHLEDLESGQLKKIPEENFTY